MKKLLSSLLALCLTLSLTALPASALELEDAKQLLAVHYVDGVPPEVLELDSLDAILEAIGDPYTFYMTAEQYNAFNQSVNGQTVVGIGATVETAFDNGGYRIMSVLPDSPALEAGIQPGDILTAADGVPMSPEVDPRVPIVGEEGTPLTITVRRGGQELDFSMVRRAVDIPIVTYESRGSAGYIDCMRPPPCGSWTCGPIPAETAGPPPPPPACSPAAASCSTSGTAPASITTTTPCPTSPT